MSVFYIRERILAGRSWASVFAVGIWKGLYEEYAALRGEYGDVAARILDATRFAYNHLLQDFVHLTYEAGVLWSEVRMMRAYTTEMEKKVAAATARANDAERQLELLGIALVEVYDQHRTKLAEAGIRPPVTYGVDTGTDDKAIVTVRQGAEVLHVIDVAKEVDKVKCLGFSTVRRPPSSPWVVTFAPGTTNFSNVESRVSAAAALEEKPARHGKKWMPYEDRLLENRYLRGWALRQLAAAHSREWEAIVYRLAYLCQWPNSVKKSATFLPYASRWFFYHGKWAKPSRSLRERALSCARPSVFN